MHSSSTRGDDVPHGIAHQRGPSPSFRFHGPDLPLKPPGVVAACSLLIDRREAGTSQSATAVDAIILVDME
ncbi:hypothetical protein CSOJ01_03703 [Colletotrichum sojae]|uniref:Uncharacterized protein n=1 Tax=Colletotrichum sojae TaxID=2175907 RepID=A0A8H6JM15_9PEZI|nr:hypothetical protein CSOJ01_03703 [Colletotrichum sojae]